MKHFWHRHPGVRSGNELSLGERAADSMRNKMGSWSFVFSALGFLAVWMLWNGDHGFDKYPFILLNLVLSCLAALQGAILLIAAKRSDQISSELAQHDYETDQAAHRILKDLAEDFATLRAEGRTQTVDILQSLRSLEEQLDQVCSIMEYIRARKQAEEQGM